jgi:hypothetical protein
LTVLTVTLPINIPLVEGPNNFEIFYSDCQSNSKMMNFVAIPSVPERRDQKLRRKSDRRLPD